MSELGESFKALKEYHQERRRRNLENADPSGWNKHTEYHWSRTLNGKRLDYWPSRNKFQYNGRVMTGDVIGFIKNREKDNEQD